MSFIAFICGATQPIIAQPILNEGEPFERFVERWNAWVDSIPEDQRAGQALNHAIQQLQAEAFTFGELWNKRGYNEGDVLSEALPWNEFWIEAPGVFHSYESKLDQIYAIARRPYVAVKFERNDDQESEGLLPNLQIQNQVFSTHSSARAASGFLLGHAVYLAFNDQAGEAYERLLAVHELSQHVSELPTEISWLVEQAIEQEFQDSIIEMLQHDPDLFTDDQLAGLQAAIVEQIMTGFADTLQFEQRVTEETWRVLYDRIDPHLTGEEINEFFYEILGSPDCLMEDSGRIFWDAAKPQSDVVVESLKNQIELYRKLSEAIEHDLAQDPSTLRSSQFSQLVQDHLTGDDEQRYMPVVMEVFLWRDLLGLQHMLDYEARNMLVVLGIYRHRISTGDWPISLSEINPKFLPYGNTDLYSGNPLNYQRGRNSAVLWAHGADRDYEGGSLFNKDADERMVKKWMPRKEWDTLSEESRGRYNGDWKFWQHTVQ